MSVNMFKSYISVSIFHRWTQIRLHRLVHSGKCGRFRNSENYTPSGQLWWKGLCKGVADLTIALDENDVDAQLFSILPSEVMFLRRMGPKSKRMLI
jgi:hypothetical protein